LEYPPINFGEEKKFISNFLITVFQILYYLLMKNDNFYIYAIFLNF